MEVLLNKVNEATALSFYNFDDASFYIRSFTLISAEWARLIKII